jgi:hypothetical protein
MAAEDNPHGAQPVELNRRRLVHMILTELGHFPADDDIEYCLMRLQERGGSMDEQEAQPCAGAPSSAGRP